MCTTQTQRPVPADYTECWECGRWFNFMLSNYSLANGAGCCRDCAVWRADGYLVIDRGYDKDDGGEYHYYRKELGVNG